MRQRFVPSLHVSTGWGGVLNGVETGATSIQNKQRRATSPGNGRLPPPHGGDSRRFPSKGRSTASSPLLKDLDLSMQDEVAMAGSPATAKK